jgi:uncharacterized membrane protein
MICVTSVIIGSLTLALVVADISFNRTDRVLTHLFLGSIATILFYYLCNFGYEKVNWVFLALIPIFIFISVVSSQFKPSDSCNSCGMPVQRCGCTKPKPRCGEDPVPKAQC